MKPFMLFLFYTICLMSYEMLDMWIIAWQRNLGHVSFLNLLRMSPMHMSMHHQMMDEFHRAQGLNYTQQSENAEFGIQSLMNVMVPKANVNVFHSWDTFKDAIPFYGVMALLCYTVCILSMVAYLIYI